METRYKFRHVNELTGLFVLGVLALVVAGAFFTGQSQRWFERQYTFDVALPEAGASGLRRGDEVFVLGVSAGRVDDITVADEGGVTARIKIRQEFERFVRADSTASIKRVFGVAGDAFVEITRGSGAALSSDRPVILCLDSENSLDRMERMLAEMRLDLTPVVKQAGATFDEWTKLGGELQTNGHQLRQFVARLDQLATGVERGEGTMGKLFTETALIEEAHKVLARADETMSRLQVVVTNLDAAAKNVHDGTARLPEITGALADETKNLPGLVQQAQASMHELEQLANAMQRHWLLRKYVRQTNSAPALSPARGVLAPAAGSHTLNPRPPR
jgi:phospholipid/cholesterol/gamma-HCH transport system substrate-binding protein